MIGKYDDDETGNYIMYQPNLYISYTCLQDCFVFGHLFYELLSFFLKWVTIMLHL